MKIILCLIVVFFAALPVLNAQEQVDFEKKVYINESGRIFINKALPLYLKVSQSTSENSGMHNLHHEKDPKATVPIYLSNEGLNTFYSPSAVDPVTRKTIEPLQNVLYQVYADSKPPVSNLQNSVSPHKKGTKIFFGKGLQITILAKDELSGIQKVFYSVNGEPFKEYTTPLTFTEEKEYLVKYFAVDNVGNAEATKMNTFTVDYSTPTTGLFLKGDVYENIVSGKSAVELTSQDAFTEVSEINYSLNGGNFVKYSGALQTAALSEGEHIIRYYSKDLVGNMENEHSFIFYVDKTPPIIIDEVMGDSYFANGKEYSSGRSKLKLSAIDNKSGVKEIFYTLNGKDWILYNDAFYLPSQKGQIYIDFYAVDKVNNKTTSGNGDKDYISKRMFNTYVDLEGPSLNHSFQGNTITINDTVYINAQTQIVLKGTDGESGMKNITYSLNRTGETDYAAPFTVTGNGINHIDFYGYDNVNNSNEKSIVFKVDQTAPQILVHFNMPSLSQQNNLPVYNTYLQMYIAATDDACGTDKIYYAINKGPFVLYNQIIRNFVKGKTYEIQIKAIDLLGNSSEITTAFIVN